MALILRTSNHDGTSHNGFRWPSSGPVEAPDWDPTPECGYGLHGLLEGRGHLGYLAWLDPDALWQIIEVDEFVDLDDKVKFPKGDVIYSGDREGALFLLAGEQTVREWVLQDPHWAYFYARHVDKGPRDDTRSAALKDPQRAYEYALDVDKCPREDTRAATLKDPKLAYYYARFVDKCPRDDTRAAVLNGGHRWAYNYALHVDKAPRDDTRAAAIKGGSQWAYLYARFVDKCGRDDTRAATLKDPKLAYYYARFVDKCPRDDTREAVIKGGPMWAYEYALRVGQE